MGDGRYTLTDGSARYEARWRDDRGKQRSKKGFRNKAARDRFLRGVLSARDRGEYQDPRAGAIRFEAWAATWLAGATNLAPKSLTLYAQALAHINPVLGGKRLDRITPEDIEAYIAGRLAAGAAPSSVHREFRTIRRALRLAVRRGRIPRSPIETVAAPRVPRDEMVFLAADELMRLADAIDGDLRSAASRADRRSTARAPRVRYRTLILVGGWGGLRWGELAGLRVGDVDVARCRVRVAQQRPASGGGAVELKTEGSQRWVTLPAGVMAELAEDVAGRSDDELVWVAPAGGPLDYSNFLGWLEVRDDSGRITRPGRGRWRRACVAAGITTVASPHALRHTAAALAIKAECHPKALQMRLGHSSIQVTLDRYGHLYPEMDELLASRLDVMLQSVAA